MTHFLWNFYILIDPHKAKAGSVKAQHIWHIWTIMLSEIDTSQWDFMFSLKSPFVLSLLAADTQEMTMLGSHNIVQERRSLTMMPLMTWYRQWSRQCCCVKTQLFSEFRRNRQMQIDSKIYTWMCILNVFFPLDCKKKRYGCKMSQNLMKKQCFCLQCLALISPPPPYSDKKNTT